MKTHFLLAALLLSPLASAQVAARHTIGDGQGGFAGVLPGGSEFAFVAALEDLDGNGTPDLAVGAPGTDDGGLDHGAVWILYLDPGGNVIAQKKISATTGDIATPLVQDARFGEGVAFLGDLSQDGFPEIAVGAPGMPGTGQERGAVFVLSLDPAGNVVNEVVIGEQQGGFTGQLDDFDLFGVGPAALGDLDGDGVTELAVGARGDDDGTPHAGALWILRLAADGTVKSHTKIAEGVGGFTGNLETFDRFGESTVLLGDVNGDGFQDIAVGAPGTDFPHEDSGAIHVLFLDASQNVIARRRIVDTKNGLEAGFQGDEYFASSLAAVGDVDGDGVDDLLVGAAGGTGPLAVTSRKAWGGSAFLLLLNSNATVKSQLEISVTAGGSFADYDLYFGIEVAALGDLDGDGKVEVAVGARGDYDSDYCRQNGCTLVEAGTVDILSLEPEFHGRMRQYGVERITTHESLPYVSGQPRLGATLTVGVDDPYGSQRALGSVPVLLLSTAQDPTFTATGTGALIPGAHLSSASLPGEVLISLPDRIGPGLVGAPWLGPGVPSTFDLAIPNQLSLLGLTIYAQGAMLDPTGANPLGLTKGFEFEIGR